MSKSRPIIDQSSTSPEVLSDWFKVFAKCAYLCIIVLIIVAVYLKVTLFCFSRQFKDIYFHMVDCFPLMLHPQILITFFDFLTTRVLNVKLTALTL